MSFQSRLHHLSDIIEGVVDVDWKQDWPSLIVIGIGTILTGPLVLMGFRIQRWNVTNTPWDAGDHWDGTRQFAVTFAIIDVCLFVAYLSFRAQLATPHQVISYPILLWYLECTLLSPALALLVEKIDSRTVRAKRVRLPSELASPPASSTVVVHEEPPPAVPPVSQQKRPPKQQKSPPSVTQKKKQVKPSTSTTVDISPFQKQTSVRFDPSHTQLPLEDVSELPEVVEESVPPAASSPHVEPTIPSSEPSKKSERRKPEPLDRLF